MRWNSWCGCVIRVATLFAALRSSGQTTPTPPILDAVRTRWAWSAYWDQETPEQLEFKKRYRPGSSVLVDYYRTPHSIGLCVAYLDLCQSFEAGGATLGNLLVQDQMVTTSSQALRSFVEAHAPLSTNWDSAPSEYRSTHIDLYPLQSSQPPQKSNESLMNSLVSSIRTRVMERKGDHRTVIIPNFTTTDPIVYVYHSDGLLGEPSIDIMRRNPGDRWESLGFYSLRSPRFGPLRNRIVIHAGWTGEIP